MGSESLSQIILEAVDLEGAVDTFDLSKKYDKDHQLLVGAVKSLQSLGNVSFFLVYVRWPKLRPQCVFGL